MVIRTRTTCPKSTADLLLPTAGTASPEHFALLMNSLWAEDRALSKTLVLAMLPESYQARLTKAFDELTSDLSPSRRALPALHRSLEHN